MERHSVIFFILGLLLCCQAQTSSTIDTCQYQEIPSILDSISYLGFDNEFHFNGQFKANFSEVIHKINFTLATDSLVRFYVAPHAVDVDLWLYNQTSSLSIARSSLDIGTEEVIFRRLPAGSYRLQLNYFGFWIGKYTATECDTLSVEFGIVPAAAAISRFTDFGTQPTEQIPAINITAWDSASTFFYSSAVNQTSVVMNVNGNGTAPYSRAVRFFASYNFTVAEAGANSIWNFEAILGAEFITSGSLGIMLEPLPNRTSGPSLRCVRSGDCIIAERDELNQQILLSSVVPGDYTLWLYDRLDEKDLTFVTQNAFTFSLRIYQEKQEESFLVCDALPIPDILEFDSPPGYLHFAEFVLLDGGKRTHNINFTIANPSYFRVRTAPHRIDIDLKLTNLDTNTLVEYAYRFGGEEAIAAVINTPGRYQISIIYFGVYTYQPCETFHLEVAIATTSTFPTPVFNCPAADQLPDLSALSVPPVGPANYTFTNNATFYAVFPPNNYNKRNVLVQNFTVSTDSVLVVNLGDKFLLGDMEVNLVSYVSDSTDGSTVTTSRYGEYRRDHEFLTGALAPGDYGLVISTGTVQKAAITGFPACAPFTLSLSLLPSVAQGTTTCWLYERLPSSLNTPQYLQPDGVVHIAQQYLAPVAPSSRTVMASENLYFHVNNASFFRVWTEPHRVDVDFYLFEGTNPSPIASGVKFNLEEEVVAKLKANTDYRLRVVYYLFAQPGVEDPDCFQYALELAIVPIALDVAPAPCVPVLPATNLIPDFTGQTDPFYVEADYRFTQTATPFTTSMIFNVGPSAVLFRAIVMQSFLWSDVNLLLTRADNNSMENIPGVGGYNYHDLQTVMLGPGSYNLTVYEPGRAQLPEFRRCVDFTLLISWEAADLVPENGVGEPLGCPSFYWPPSFNSLQYLSPLTGNRLHIKKDVLVNIATATDSVNFMITEPSMFTIGIPAHGSVDVDFALYSVTDSGTLVPVPGGFRNGIAEENLMLALNITGKYQLNFRYFPFYGQSLPAVADCVDYPVEISIIPIADLEAVTSVTQTCTTTPLPATLVATNNSASTYSLSLPPGAAVFATSSFTVTNGAILQAELSYYAPAFPLYMQLVGSLTTDTSAVQKTYKGVQAHNRVFIYRSLPPGTYTLNLMDLMDVSLSNLTNIYRDTKIKCGTYEFQYTLINTDSYDPCSDTRDLPTDLYSAAGGSAPFGGPQAADGSIRISGSTFGLDPRNKNNFVLFNVPVPSFMRMFAMAPKGNDLDFYVYNNQTRPPGSLVYLSLGVDTIESGIVKLNNQSNPYLLNVYAFKVDTTVPCPQFSFEFAMKPVATIQQELACPATMPVPEVPPASFFINRDTFLYDDFIFTKSRVDANTNNFIFTYRMRLTVIYQTTLYSSIGFDFIANDFRLVLRNSSDLSVIEQGSPSPVEDVGYYTFLNLLYADLEPGVYYLDIVEDMHRKNLGFTEFCHRFAFLMTAFADLPATIRSVTPPSGNQLDPTADVRIEITFSETVAQTNAGLLDYIRNNHAIYLFNTAQPTPHVLPTYARLDGTRKVLELVFSAAASNFLLRNTYQLTINAQYFNTTDDGTPFNNPTRTFTYKMFDCVCSGHGNCTTGNQGICTCQTGYGNRECQDCAVGYHVAADACVADVACQANTCNGFGTCDDSQGFPQCTCNLGYASSSAESFCDICAGGFSNYPNCSRDDTSRVPLCTAPLLPSSLSAPGLLGFNGRVHLQDQYFIDVVNFKHDMYFNLSVDSVLRVYSEPHKVDIDLWLYSLKDDGSIDKIIESQISIRKEETIFQVLSGLAGGHPKQYLLRFRYYTFNTRASNCETFNLELEIEPLSAFNTELAAFQTKCQANNVLPQPVNNPPATGFYPVDPVNGLTYTPATIFTVNRINPQPTGPNYFWSFSFNVAPPTGKLAVLEAQTGSRFIAGPVELMLESGNNANHCGTQGSASLQTCDTGDNFQNRNRFARELAAGNYTLWAYESRYQSNLTKCAIFDFKLKISYLDVAEKDLGCPGNRLPPTLNAPGYFDSINQVHVEDNFLLDGDSSTVFTITEFSYLRVAGNADSVLSFTLTETTSNTVTQGNYAAQPELFAELPPGNYRLDTNVLIMADAYCPLIRLELQIVPLSSLCSTCNNCPGAEVLPTLPAITVPFDFGHPDPTKGEQPTSFFAYTNNPVVKEFPFTIQSTTFIEAILASDFVTSGLKVALVSSTGTNVGVYDYNRNVIKDTLDAGQYRLQILNPTNTRPVSFPPCAEFNLELSLRSADPNNMTQADLCRQTGQDIPTNLNSVRYLGTDGNFIYQTDGFRIPDFPSYLVRKIPFTVNNASLFRVYTEPHAVDIDLSLFQQGTASPVANGGYNFNQEEEIVYPVQPGVNYTLQLTLWKWNRNIPPCSTFNMQIGMAPIPPTSTPVLCPANGADNWPAALPPTITVPFAYNSMKQGANLYFQQRTGEVRTYTTSMQLTEPHLSVRVFVGYDFVINDLMVKLKNTKTNQTYYGDNTPNGNLLLVNDLDLGTYELSLYEVVTTPDGYLGCASFTYDVAVNRYEAPVQPWQYEKLPDSFDTTAFLASNQVDRLHLQAIYSMFNDMDTEGTSFTVSADSLLHVTTSHSLEELSALQIVLMKGNNLLYASLETMQATLTPDQYLLQYRRPLGSSFGKVIVESQFALQTVSSLQAEVTTAGCTSDVLIPPVQISPAGYYAFQSDDLLISQATAAASTLLQSIPFTVTKSSRVYLRVTAPFILSGLVVYLNGTKTGTGEILEFYGTVGRNLAEVNAIVPAGDWMLYLEQADKFEYMTTIPHCTPFSASLTISDASTGAGYVDCAGLDMLPWNLTAGNGGSFPFGGPIDGSGTLSMYGPSFLFPTTIGQVDTIALNIRTPSVFTVVAKTSYLARIAYSLLNTTGSSLTPLSVYNDAFQGQHAEIFTLPFPDSMLGTSLPYSLSLAYTVPRRQTCPSYGLQIVMQPVSQLTRSLVCPAAAPQPVPQLIVQDATKVYANSVDSYWTASAKDQFTTGNTFTYEMQVNITAPSSITALIGYNTLANYYRLRLLTIRTTGVKAEIGKSALTVPRGRTSVNSYQSLTGTVNPGVYFIQIVEDRFNSLPASVDVNSICYPFTWNLQIVPTGATTTYLSSVQPSSAYGLDPTQPLTVEVSFSQGVYYQGALVTAANPAPIQAAFVLQPVGGGFTTVQPSAVSNDGQYWILTFNGGLQPAMTYQLNLVNHILKSSTGDDVQAAVPASFRTMDVTCGGNGLYDHGVCYCNRGYAGPECSLCDLDFVNINTGLTAPICVEKLGKLCLQTSCGCSHGTAGPTCIPIGRCNDTTGVITCKCPLNYAGDHCEMCAVGYEKYEQGCTKQQSCLCARGHCNPDTQKCVCPSNWQGDTCEVCAAGYTGANCDAVVSPPDQEYPALNAARIGSIVLVALTLVVTAGWFVFRRFIAARVSPSKYVQLDLEHLDTEDGNFTELDENNK